MPSKVPAVPNHAPAPGIAARMRVVLEELMKALATLLSSVFVLAATTLSAQTTLTADGAGSTYELIESKGYGIEVPDCGHSGRHFSETFDSELGRNVFVAHAHRDQDDDRCINTDRQRTELRGGGGSLQGPLGPTTVYRWKVKLASGFKASPNFTHIMQIKAYGNGCGSGAPILTITPRNSSLEVNHPRSGGVVRSAPLSSFAGVWTEVYVRTTHANSAPLEVTIRRLSDGAGLISYSATGRDMWDDGCGYGALKLGIYRSLNSRSSLRDEDVRFNDVCVARGSAVCPSSIGGPSPTPTPTPTPTPRPTVGPTSTPTATPTPGGSFTEITPAGSAVTASTNDGNLPQNTVDDNLATRWSANGDGQWIQFDLGSERTVAYVRVAAYNGNTRQNRFDIQVATESGAWTTVLPNAVTTGTTTAEETFDFADVPARWVRYVGHGNTVNTFNSVTEVSLFTPAGGSPTATPTAGPTATPTPGPSTPVELTPAGSAVTASTNDGNLPPNTVDDNLATRWSANGDGQWIQYDLGTTRTVSYVNLAWYQGDTRRSTFDVLVSGSPTGPWTTALPGRQSSGTSLALEMHDFPDVSGRYVRLVGHGNTANLWSSITETQIWGN